MGIDLDFNQHSHYFPTRKRDSSLLYNFKVSDILFDVHKTRNKINVTYENEKLINH